MQITKRGSKSMKKLLVLFLVAVICCSLVACGNKVDNLIEEIATLENDEITLADEERIDKIYDKYFALSEEDKAKITNYDILKEASEEVNRLVRTKETMQQAPAFVEEYIKSCLKTPSAMKVIKTEVYASKESMWEAFVRMQYTGQNTFGGTLEETCLIKVDLIGGGYSDVIKVHWGDAHEQWEDTGWPDSLLEEIDFENKYVPNIN